MLWIELGLGVGVGVVNKVGGWGRGDSVDVNGVEV